MIKKRKCLNQCFDQLVIGCLLVGAFLCASVSHRLLLSPASAEEKAVIKGRVLDVEGNPLKGASVFVYDSPDMRRRVDFLSSQSEVDGNYKMTVPAGKYWLVSRFKKEGRYALGPLMSDDKSSGEPRGIELASGAELTVDFTVMDLREAARMKKKTSEDFIKIKGRIIEANGIPVKNFFAFANRSAKIPGIPDYVSSWTEDDGNYALFLPRGKYYIGASAVLPRDKDYSVNKEIAVESERSDLDIVIKIKQ